MRIAIVGSGGVGGYFGGRLAATGAGVTFLARGAHLEALRTRGLRIDSPKGNAHLPHVNASDDPAAIGPVDIVFFAVKLYDTDGALALLPPLIGPETVVIRHTAMDRLIFGELDGSRSRRLEWLLEACRPAGFQATLSTDINVEIWTKFVRLSVLSGLTAVTRSPIGVIREDPELFAMLKTAVKEAMTVAHAKGVAVPESTVADVAAAYIALPPQAKSSMLEDLERGRRLELPWLSGAVVRIGREVGVDTPTHRFITAVLKPHVRGSLG
jgi:2-dehydropantoate 2-reductase